MNNSLKTLKELLDDGYVLADKNIIFREKDDKCPICEKKEKTLIIYKRVGDGDLFSYYSRYVKKEKIAYNSK